MMTKVAAPGAKYFKSFKDYFKDLTQTLEKEHAMTHNAHIKARQELLKKGGK